MNLVPASADPTVSTQPPPRAALPPDCAAGENVAVYARELTIESGVELGDGVRLVGDRIHLGAGVRIGRGADLRSSALSVGAGSEIGADVRVLCADRFAVGAAARICARVDIVARGFEAGRLLYLGPSTTVGYGGTLESTADVTIGDRVTIGPHNILNANRPIVIGSDVGSGCYVSVWTHGYHFGHSVLKGYSTAFQGVRIGQRVWLGYHCSIMPGVEIGDECIVASGAVVAKTFPARLLLAGVPAKVKSEFTQPPSGDAEALEAVREAVESWCRELRWKGATAERLEVPASTGNAEPVPSARWSAEWGGRHRVIELWERVADVRQALPVRIDALSDRIILALDGEPKPEQLVVPIFVLRRGLLTGPSDELVEDLRDHLRRQTMPCGDERTFSSIIPRAFQRLIDASAAGAEADA